MDGISTNGEFGPIEIFQFGEWTGNKIFNDE